MTEGERIARDFLPMPDLPGMALPIKALAAAIDAALAKAERERDEARALVLRLSGPARHEDAALAEARAAVERWASE